MSQQVGGRATPDYLFKIILVGDTAVGKSCLLTRFIDPREEMLGTHDATIGVEFMSKVLTLDNKRIKLEIWDTAGQEAYQSITRSYFRGAHGAIICYDVTRKDTFDKAVDKWLNDITECAQPNVVIALGGNKCDLNEKRKVQPVEGEEAAKRRGLEKEKEIIFRETSAKDGTNVEGIFEELVRKIYDQVKEGRLEANQKKKKVQNLGNSTTSREQKREANCCS